MLQGVLARGTAHGIASLSPYVAGKTGTTDGENDAWFVGFTNEVTVAVWVGYDNADGKRRTLGGGQTGASVAIPIFEPIIQAAWAFHAPRAALAPPSPEAKRDLVAVRSGGAGDEPAASGRGFVEYLRRDRNGQARDTRYDLVSRADAEPPDPGYADNRFDPWGRPSVGQPQPSARQQPWGFGGLFGWQPPPPDEQRIRPRQRNYRDGYFERD
jgi:membrane carboxypeptidase/penicillin-binding protein